MHIIILSCGNLTNIVTNKLAILQGTTVTIVPIL